jgi:large subunit ribosomal protein L9
MASHVKVVLKKDVETLGLSGQLIRVKPGYARNYLIPRGIAAMATRANVHQIEHEQALAKQRAEKVRSELQEVAKSLASLRVQVAKEAGPEGKLFGSVTAQDVVDALKARGVEIERKRIVLPDEPIKVTGDYDIIAKYGHDVTATFTLSVTTKS